MEHPYVSDALAAAQAEYLPVKATSINPKNNTMYAPLEDLQVATVTALTKYRVSVWINLDTSEECLVLTAKLTFRDISTESRIQLPGDIKDINDPLIETYARRMYQYITGVIVQNSTLIEEQETSQAEEDPDDYIRISEEQVEVIAGELGSREDIARLLFKQFSVKRISELPLEHYKTIVKRIRDNKRI